MSAKRFCAWVAGLARRAAGEVDFARFAVFFDFAAFIDFAALITPFAPHVRVMHSSLRAYSTAGRRDPGGLSNEKLRRVAAWQGCAPKSQKYCALI